jgi:glutamyl-tRNA reductase
LERAVVRGDTLAKLVVDLARTGPVAEVFVLSTCNRLEVYADVDRFHAGVAAISELVARHCGIPDRELARYLYVHYEDGAVSHLLAVACGLDSMVVGDEQILGQVRSAIRLAAELGAIGRVLGGLGRVALRAGKRTRAETGIGRTGASLLSLAIEQAAPGLAPGRGVAAPGVPGLAGRDVLVVGAGSMSALAVARAGRDGAGSITVANRTRPHAQRLAARSGVAATRVIGLAALPAALAAADVVICCTGAAGPVITADMVPAGRRENLVFLDLAMPRDVQPAVASLPGVAVIGLDTLAGHGMAAGAGDVAAARAIMTAERAAYQSAIDAARVAPVVAALRAKAAGVADAELARLAGRLSAEGVSGRALDEIARTVRRVAAKLLHSPTVRVKQLAGSAQGEDYAAALRILFDLDPRAVDALTGVPTDHQNPQDPGAAPNRSLRSW